MKCSSYHMFFDTISNETRMSIIESLLKGEKSVNEICRDVDEEQSKVSHSLRKLMQCNFLNVKREGKKRVYSLNDETIIPILKMVDKHVARYCQKCMKRKAK